jgi:leukotriene-A4 hydrolase
LFLQEEEARLQKHLTIEDVQVCKNDPNSYSNCDQITTTHFHLNITVDFNKSSLIGTNTLNLTALADGVTTVVLDYQGMTVSKVEQCNGQGAWAPVTTTSVGGRFGNALIVNLLSSKLPL